MAGAFAKASMQASSGRAMRSIVVSFRFDDSKTRGAVDRCHRQTVKENLSPILGSSVFLRALFRATHYPPACPAYPGFELPQRSSPACHALIPSIMNRTLLLHFSALWRTDARTGLRRCSARRLSHVRLTGVAATASPQLSRLPIQTNACVASFTVPQSASAGKPQRPLTAGLET